MTLNNWLKKTFWDIAWLVTFLVIVAFVMCGCSTLPHDKGYCIMEIHDGKVSDIFKYIETLENEQEHCFKKSYYEDQIAGLGMRNTSLEAANTFLQKILILCKEDRAKNAPCVYGVKK